MDTDADFKRSVVEEEEDEVEEALTHCINDVWDNYD